MDKFDISLAEAMELLNLKNGFTEEDFRVNYRNLIKNIHPDTLGSLNESSRKIIEDEVKRVNIAKGIIESFLKQKNSDNNTNQNSGYYNNTEDQQRREREKKQQQEEQKREKNRDIETRAAKKRKRTTRTKKKGEGTTGTKKR
jgi:hypothetical protein